MRISPGYVFPPHGIRDKSIGLLRIYFFKNMDTKIANVEYFPRIIEKLVEILGSITVIFRPKVLVAYFFSLA